MKHGHQTVVAWVWIYPRRREEILLSCGCWLPMLWLSKEEQETVQREFSLEKILEPWLSRILRFYYCGTPDKPATKADMWRFLGVPI
jgi:hypothetical protein